VKRWEYASGNVGTDRDGLEKDWRRGMGETGGHCFPFDTEIGEFRATYGTRAGLQAAYGDYYRKKLGFIILF